ncbi:MAG TPA: segregation/condensation protein A [Polyangiaceae bacterium]|nr:segregation/condensation protein A [Polyangiaceae bacterium]
MNGNDPESPREAGSSELSHSVSGGAPGEVSEQSREPMGPGLSKASARDLGPSDKTGERGGEEASPEGGGGYQISLPMFEGPLDLLLHLIQKHELDILNIPIAFIIEKYFEYIKAMQELSIDVASEYLVMAATLVHIKSRSLLPPDPSAIDEETGEPEEDPRSELIRRLLAYQKYKLAAEQLGGRSVLGRDVFLRGAPMQEVSGPAELLAPSLFQLMDAFRTVLDRVKQLADHEIDFERISITDRIGQLSELLRERGEARFEDLFVGQVTRADLIVTFLAILEMTRLRMTRLRQDNPLEPIFVELSVKDGAALADALGELSEPSMGGELGARELEPTDDSSGGFEPNESE